jgi:hypothetical protein
MLVQSKPASSLTFQVLTYFDTLYSVFYFLAGIALYCYKGYKLIYPRNAIGPEVGILIFFMILQFSRLFLGQIGNKTESQKAVIMFVVMSLPALLAAVFFVRL